MYGYYYFDPTYLLLIIGMVLSLLGICKGKEYVFCLQQSAQCIGAYRRRCCQTDSSYVGNYGCYGSTHIRQPDRPL